MIKAAIGSDSPITGASYESYYGPGFEDIRRRAPDITRAGTSSTGSPRSRWKTASPGTIEWWLKTHA